MSNAVPVTTFTQHGAPVAAGTSKNNFIGTTATLNVSFANADPAQPGYAPFIDLVLPAGNSGVRFIDATFLDQPVTSQMVTFDANGHANSPVAKDASGNPVVIDGPPGARLVVLTLPFGSFTPGQTPADIAVNLGVSSDALLGSLLDITATGGFALGNSPTGVTASNPPIFGARTDYGVVPQVVILNNVYIGPEQETATGPSYPRSWNAVATIAPNQTITDLVLTQKLPDGAVFLPGNSALIDGNGTAAGTVTYDAATNTVTGTFTSPETGGPGNTPTLQAGFYVTQDYANGTSILDPATGSFAPLTDSAGLTATLHTSNPANPTTATIGPVNDTITAKSIAIQKGVADLTHGAAATQPGDTLQYSLAGQVSNYFDLNDLMITDRLGDGQTFDTAVTPGITIADRGVTLYSGPVAANEVTVAPKGTDGTTLVTYDVSKILTDHGQPADLNGGTAAHPAPATANLTFDSTIDQTYVGSPAPSVSTLVDQGDTIGNTVMFSGQVVATGAPISDNSGTAITLPTNTVSKSLYAVNGVRVSGPVTIQAGDLLTYDLQLTTPLTSTQHVSLIDFLPLPTFDATTVTAFTPTVSAVAPPEGTADFGPANTFAPVRETSPITLSSNATANSLTFDLTDYTDQPAGAYPGNTADILFTVKAGDAAFADRLLLTNQVHTTETNSFGANTTSDAIVQVKLGQPELKVEKASEATTSPTALFSGDKGPAGIVDDATLAADPLGDTLTGIVAGDTVSFKVVVENTGSGPNGAFNVILHDTIPTGFGTPGNVVVTDGAGHALAYTAIGGGLFDPNGGIELTDPGALQGSLAADNPRSGANIAVITYDTVADAAVPIPNFSLKNVATITHYAAEADGANHTAITPAGDLTASSTVFTASPLIAKAVVSTSAVAPNASGANDIHDLAIGETATYDITVTLPKGTSGDVVADVLPNSPAGELDLVSATVKSIGADISGSQLAVGATSSTGRFSFGSLTDAVNTQGPADQIVVEIVARAVDKPNNAGGGTLTNTGSVITDDPNAPGARTATSATATETLVEPSLHVAKTSDIHTAQAGDTVTYTVEYSNTGTAAAYTSVLTDPVALGPDAAFNAGSVKITHSTALGAAVTTGNTAGDTSVAATVAEIDPGQVVDISYTATLNPGAVSNDTLTNTASVSGSTLPGSDPNARTETASGRDTVLVQDPTIAKALIAGTDPNIALPLLAPGETGTYRVVVTVPHGVSPALNVVDYLPTDLHSVPGSAVIVSTGANLSGVALTTTSPDIGSLYYTLLNFALGTVTDTGSGATTAADQVVIGYRASVAPTAASTSGTNDTDYVGVSVNGVQTSASDAPAYVATPQLLLSKTADLHGAAPVAGAGVTYTLTVYDGGNSPAYDVSLSDTLPPDEIFDAGSLTSSAGTATYANGTIGFTDPAIAAGATPVTITYSERLAQSVTPGELITNTASVSDSTQPTGGYSQPAVTAQATVAVDLTPSEAKTILALSNPFSTTQVVTGETVTYQLVTTLQPGTQEFRLADTLPAGLTFNSATVASVGANVTGIVPGQVSPNAGVFDFGTVVAAPGTAASDQVVVDITATVAKVAGGTVFSNTAAAEVSAPGSTTTGLQTGSSTAPTLTDVKSSLSGTVFTDTNDDGVLNQADTGLAGVTVQLLDGTGAPTGATATTDANGRYSFGGLEVGRYGVQVVAPGADGFSPVGTNANPALDSIVNATGTTAPVTLNPGADTPNQNAGVYAPVSLSGTVFNDQNADGAQEADDSGVTGDTVHLLDASGTPIAATATAGDGSYSFTGLKPGTYSVAVTDPAGDTFSPKGTSATAPDSIVNASGVTAAVTLTSGQAAPNQNAGVFGPGGLSGTVFTDGNADGVIDGADTGLAGVTVQLLDSTGAPTGATAVTDAHGAYRFTGLHPANYAVHVVAPGMDGFSPVGTNANPALDSIVNGVGATTAVAVTSNANTPNQNAGVYVPAAIAGIVFTDQNADGVRQAGDTGIAGDTVTLLSNGATVATTVTAAGGSYSFPGLMPGSYTVQVTDPAGDMFSPAAGNAPADSVVNGTGATPVITVASGQSAPYENAGAFAPATLSGHAFFDTNGDGQQEAGEPNQGGVTVTLLDAGGHPAGSTTTAADGSYSFPGLTPGSYSVQFTTPDGDLISPVGTGPAASDSIVGSTGTTPPVTLVSGQSVGNQNAGFYQTGALSGTVFTDNNDDGVIDGADKGLAGVTVQLLDGTGKATGAVTTTDMGGRYSFTGIIPGRYSVQVVAPAGDSFSPKGTNANPALDSIVGGSGATAPVPVTAGQDTPNQNAGVFAPGSISGNVFIDQNADGAKQPGDANAPGQGVNLLNGAGAVIASTTTDANGNYSFQTLPPGSYDVQVVAPGGDTFSPPGTSTTLEDSIVNAAGKTPGITLTSGLQVGGQNAGEVPPASIEGTAFLDAHCDGTDDYGDPAFKGVTVKLYDGTGTFTGQTATTDAAGHYRFGALPPGQYQVQFVAPLGTSFAAERVGGNNLVNSDANAAGFSEVFAITAGQADATRGVGFGLTGGYSNSPTTTLNATQTVFAGGNGSVTVIGDSGPQADVIDGGTGDNILVGGMGNTTIEGGYGNNIILGGCGPFAQIQGLGQNDFIFGGTGNDLIQVHSGNEYVALGVGNQVLAAAGGHNTFIANANGGTIGYSNGVFTGITPGDRFVTSGSNTAIVYNKGDGVIQLDNYQPQNGDTLQVNGYAAPTAVGFVNGYNVLYFGPNAAVLFSNGGGAVPANAAVPGVTYHAALPATAPLTVSVDTNGYLTLQQAGAAAPIFGPGNGPTLTGAVAGQTTTGASPVTPFFGVRITDPGTAQTETVSVSPFSPNDGTFANLGAGSVGNGTYSISGSAAAVTAAVDALQFVPFLSGIGVGQSLTARFTIAVTDTAGLGASNTATTLTETRAALPPVIAGTVANQATSDTATLRPFANTTVSDRNGGQLETATVKLSNPANGALGPYSGSTDAATGTFTVSSTAQGVTAVLQQLTFTPVAHEAAAGSTVTTAFELTVVDGLGDTASDTKTSVAVQQTAAPVVPVPIVPVPPPAGVVTGSSPYGGNIITLGAGNHTVSLTGYANTVTLGGGTNTVDAGYDATINAAGGNQTVTLSGYSNRVTITGSAVASVTGGDGQTTVTLGTGTGTVAIAGNGNTVSVGAGTDTIDAGYGAHIGAAGGTQGITLHGYNSMVFIGGAATATIGGGDGGSQITTTSGSATIALNGYGNVVTTGGSSDTITDSAQGFTRINVGNAQAGGAQPGLEILQNFAANAGSVVNVLGAAAAGLTPNALLQSLTTNAAGSAQLALPGNAGTVVFAGLTPNQLHAANFRAG